MVSLTIDGNNISVPAGTTILEAARQLGIHIPTLCWLQKVSPTGACRVCAVEVEGVDRPMTACNTPVKEGIKVTTQSERLSVIRRKIMELMLVNHPLDCPVCDAAGECDLQDSCYGLNVASQEFSAALERRPIRYDWNLLESDPNRCILCEKCVKVDHEIVGCDAIAVVNRGEATIIDTVDGKPLNCEFCGNCIAACPTGTLISKPFKFKGRPWTFNVTKSVCTFCASGCQIEYHSKNGRVERVTSDDQTFNAGNLCIHGRFGYAALNEPNRLTAPLMKNNAGTQSLVDWETALQTLTDKISAIVASNGPDAMAGISSCRVTNEENYLFQKLFRTAIGTNNLDSEARFGYAPAIAVLQKMLGLTGASASIDRIDTAEAILVLGSDLNAESTGMEYRVIKAATKNDAKLVVANMRNIKLKKFANVHLQYRPGGEIALVNGVMKALLEAGLVDQAAVANATGNFAALQAALAKQPLSDLAAAAGVSEAALKEAAVLLGTRKLAIIFGADIIRSSQADTAVTAVANLALLTNTLGNEAGGLFPVEIKNNTQGLLDMGVAPTHLPGFHALNATLPAFAKSWGTDIPASAGKDFWGIIEGIEQGRIKGLYLLGTNPLVSAPNNGRIRRALEKLELLIVQDISATDTAALADVVLPAAAAAEKSGTFTTPDRRLQTIEKAVSAPGAAREDWAILAEVCNRLSGQNAVITPATLLAEIKELVAGYPAQQTPGQGKPAFVPCESTTAAANGLMLLVGPLSTHNGTMTTRSENNLAVEPEGRVEISPADAGKLGISADGAIKITSANGSIIAPVRISDRLQAGMIFAPCHFAALNANGLLTSDANLVAVTVSNA